MAIGRRVYVPAHNTRVITLDTRRLFKGKMNYDLIAKRIEIATRNITIFTGDETESKGMEDRRKIREMYVETKEIDGPIESLKQARRFVISEILKEEFETNTTLVEDDPTDTIL